MTRPELRRVGGQDFHLSTDLAQRVNDLLACVMSRHDVGVVMGPHGVGKTHSVTAEALNLGLETVHVTVSSGSPAKEVLVRMLREMTGEIRRAEGYVLAMELEERLSERSRLVVIDEAHFLPRKTLDTLSVLHGRPGVQFGLAYVGGPALERQIKSYPHLASRVGRHVMATAPDFEDLVEHVRQLHPCLAASSFEHLARLNLEFGESNWRRWVKIAHSLVEIETQTSSELTALDGDLVDCAVLVAEEGLGVFA